MKKMPKKSDQNASLSLSKREQEIAILLREYVEMLAQEIGERNMYQLKNLRRAGSYIEKIFTSFGYHVKKQCYVVDDEEVCNFSVELPGIKNSDEIVVIGAHYDTVYHSPGANDNASGVAAMLALAHAFSTQKPEKTLRFIAFVNEESPYFYTRNMGSYQYAKQAKEANENIIAMLSLETMGYYSDEEKSQKYPFPYMFFYPNVGNFIAFVSNLTNKSLVQRCMSAFRQHSTFPMEGTAAPAFLPGVVWSDHWAFCYHDYPSIMITDTAFYRYPYYHTSLDTADKLMYPQMAQVVLGLEDVIKDLAGSEDGKPIVLAL